MGISRKHAERSVISLREKNIIRTKSNGRRPLTVWLQKDHSLWKSSPQKKSSETAPSNEGNTAPNNGDTPDNLPKNKESVTKTAPNNEGSHNNTHEQCLHDRDGMPVVKQRKSKTAPNNGDSPNNGYTCNESGMVEQENNKTAPNNGDTPNNGGNTAPNNEGSTAPNNGGNKRKGKKERYKKSNSKLDAPENSIGNDESRKDKKVLDRSSEYFAELLDLSEKFLKHREDNLGSTLVKITEKAIESGAETLDRLNQDRQL